MQIHPAPRKPNHTHTEPDDPEPGMLPVDPDEGPMQPSPPAEPEHDRPVDPQA